MDFIQDFFNFVLYLVDTIKYLVSSLSNSGNSGIVRDEEGNIVDIIF